MPNLFELYVEPHPIFYKDNEWLTLDRRTEEQNFSRLSILKSVLLFFCQKIAKGESRMPNLFELYAEPHPILSKDKER